MNKFELGWIAGRLLDYLLRGLAFWLVFLMFGIMLPWVCIFKVAAATWLITKIVKGFGNGQEYSG